MSLQFIVKLGGAGITDKNKFETLNINALQEILNQLKKVYEDGKRFIVVHGAGSFGHFQAKEAAVHLGGIEKEPVRTGFVKTRCSVKKLNELVVGEMIRGGIPAVGISPCGFWSTTQREISQGDVTGIQQILENGLIPVLHGDAVMDHELGCTILSGDAIVKHLAFHLHPQFVVFLSNVAAIYSRPPEHLDALPIRNIFVQKNGNWFAEGKGVSLHFSVDCHDTTGGIQGKIKECVEMACHGFKVLFTLISSNSSLEAMLEGPRALESPQWNGTLISLENTSS